MIDLSTLISNKEPFAFNLDPLLEFQRHLDGVFAPVTLRSCNPIGTDGHLPIESNADLISRLLEHFAFAARTLHISRIQDVRVPEPLHLVLVCELWATRERSHISLVAVQCQGSQDHTPQLGVDGDLL